MIFLMKEKIWKYNYRVPTSHGNQGNKKWTGKVGESQGIEIEN